MVTSAAGDVLSAGEDGIIEEPPSKHSSVLMPLIIGRIVYLAQLLQLVAQYRILGHRRAIRSAAGGQTKDKEHN
jgi:hypothetical protein